MLAGLINAIDDDPALASLMARMSVLLAIGAVVSLVIGALQPAAWPLAPLLSLVLAGGSALRASALPASPVQDGR